MAIIAIAKIDFLRINPPLFFCFFSSIGQE
jgi:hypothetical protein